MLRNVFLFFLLVTPAPAWPEVQAYTVSYKGFQVGEGLVVAENVQLQGEPDLKLIRFQLGIDIAPLGFRLYARESHQIALFDESGSLVCGMSSVRVNGELYEFTYRGGNEGVYVSGREGKHLVPKRDITMTTLHPLFSKPKSGDWLDLTYGKLVPYRVQGDDSRLEITNPRGRETVRLDERGGIEVLESHSRSGTVTMERIAQGAEARREVSPPVRISDDQFLRQCGDRI